MPSRAFVTGIGGFAGGHLAEALVGAGDRVEGLVRPSGLASRPAGLPPQVRLHPCDIRAEAGLAEAIREARPDVVYHLAAATSVSQGEANPKATLEVNVTGTLHLLEALRKEAPQARVVHVSSSEVYGRVPPEANPVREDRPEAPFHVYGLSKLLSEQIARFYQRRHGCPAVILRPFNHIGPRQSDRFVCASLAKQLALIEAGRAPPVLRVGNLDPVRDFTDVRDMVAAYRLAAARCRPGSVLNVASGQGTSIADLIDQLLSLSSASVEVRQDPERVRAAEIPVLIGDASAFQAQTGWRRRYDLKETLGAILAHWRKAVVELREA